MSHTEKTIDSTRIFEGKVVRLRRDTVELENGKQTFREVIDHPGGVSILAMDEEGKIFLSGSSAIHLAKCCWNCLLESWSREKILPRADAENCGRKPAAPQVGLNPWAV
ncbi:MAG: hypothetical protein V8T62_10965 [Oscillospiraceae bacterium]